jgi:thiol-disulfide isomerase/thioredoxin
MNKVYNIIFFIIIIYIGGCSFFKKRYEEIPPRFPKHSNISVYGQVDYNWKIYNLNGKEVSLSEFKGKTIFLNFWATWCGPCIAEMPKIQKLYDSLKNENIAFILVSDEDSVTVQKFINDKQFTFPIFLHKKEVPEVFHTVGIPVTFVINKDGAIVFKHLGSAKWDDETSLHFLRGLK